MYTCERYLSFSIGDSSEGLPGFANVYVGDLSDNPPMLIITSVDFKPFHIHCDIYNNNYSHYIFPMYLPTSHPAARFFNFLRNQGFHETGHHGQGEIMHDVIVNIDTVPSSSDDYRSKAGEALRFDSMG